jgi:hypothetical protein
LRHAERTVAYFMPIAQLTCRAAIKPMSNNSLGPPEGVLNNLPRTQTVVAELAARVFAWVTHRRFQRLHNIPASLQAFDQPEDDAALRGLSSAA